VYEREPPSHACPATARLPHDSAVTGVSSDGCNKLLVSCGLDGHLRIWSFKAASLQSEVDCGSPLSSLRLHPASALAAVAGDDFVLRMVDVEAGKLVRKFKGHRC
jgi:U3 small nucleolar RNA-associated protein 21